jgi:DNA polymerase III sliding clamp (beta) subunit (PCNA family)
LEALRRIDNVLSGGRHTKTVFLFERDLLTLKTTNPEVGTSIDRLRISYEGESWSSVFSHKYLKEALSAMASETILFRTLKPESGSAKITGAEDPGYIGVFASMK